MYFYPGVPEAAYGYTDVSSKFWQKKALDRPWQPSTDLYLEMWASDDAAPQQSANSEFLGLRVMVQRLSFSRTLLDFFLNANTCWST